MRLLLAEDERSLSRAVAEILKREGFEADAAYDGKEALEKVGSGQYDALILDVMMPGMDGITVLKTLRERGNKIPILMLTAKSTIEDKLEGLENGADDYLTKPFDVRELVARIKIITKSGTDQSGDVLKKGNVTLDGMRLQMASPSGSFRLSRREYQMMDFLMRGGDEPIDTGRFLEKFWWDERDADDSTVLMYVSYLRKKLAAVHANIQIDGDVEDGFFLQPQKIGVGSVR